MKTFLSEVVDAVLSENRDTSHITFVLPGKRAGIFLKKELQSRSTKTAFAPEIYSIEEFVQEISGIRLMSNIQLLFEFYNIYRDLTPGEQQEDFNSFSRWAQTVLQDFNEIDRYLIPPEAIFSHLSAIKEMDHWYLSEEKTPLQQQYIRFWDTLGSYYRALSHSLVSSGNGYQGLIYRQTLRHLEAYTTRRSDRHFIFVGFNALNNAETTIIQEFLRKGARIYWDTDKVFIDDTEHDAGLFMRQYQKNWRYYQEHPFEKISSHFSEKKNINIIGIPGKTGQAMYAGNILSSLQEQGDLSGTALILGDEALLNPVLNAIPDHITGVNITGGFPLAYSPLASWFRAFFRLMENENSGTWYYQHVIHLISHPVSGTLLNRNGRDTVSEFLKYIQDNNIVFVTREHLDHIFTGGEQEGALPAELRALLFFSPGHHTSDEVIQKCISLTEQFREAYSPQNNPLFLEYLFHFHEIFNQLLFFNKTYQVLSLSALTQVYTELLLQQTVDFQGEPLEGLQVMGVLESRNLDFDTVILTSANEGNLPSGKSGNSFIPFDLKVAYGLPTYKEKDAIYAYHFYRLLQRARKIYLLYNTDAGSFDGAEKSRFLQQLTTFSQPLHITTEKIALAQAAPPPSGVSTVPKTPSLMEAIRQHAERGFSPTSLTNYIRNPMEFYQQSVLGIRNEYDVEETIAANTLGTIVHDTLEDLYKPLEGTVLKKKHIAAMQQEAESLIRKNFAAVYQGGDFSRGKNLLSYEVAKRYLKNFLKLEQKRLENGDTIRIIAVETDLRIPVRVPGVAFPVYLRGKVDRVEEINGTLRFIDYKTGRVDPPELELPEWEVLSSGEKYGKAFQLLCYAYMLTRDPSYPLPVEAAIISFKNLQKGFLRFAKKGASRSDKNHIISEETFEHFTTQLYHIISEICNPDIPFSDR
ncbi:PD-(D/E)XK nuclease family protein [Sinomicrobium soli]|uniref:PD-(D/E)XK nuclease family protein n=1 Tax=Sinomicrobium sp. N-1-3-6 TaxID=2219864 RepID=UPI000DCECD76|nr:PD-(D/E)XK nuclease family protein [Sinomicrobium sp. N-1-3-6]RAV28500.1 PD-(D/E)XK nuclease family protein [Sinomicrobium sp. N-1-3-6]